MSEPPKSPLPTDLPRWASTVIPTLWTSEQALAVFELLDELREAVWTRYGCQIQDLLRDEQGGMCADIGEDDPAGDRPF
jgi:hypothetical protein